MGKRITIIQGHPDPAEGHFVARLGTLPALPALPTLPTLFRGFFEQTFRYGYALDAGGKHGMVRKLLKGRSARIIVTMGMPAAVYRYYFRAHGLKSPESGVLGICGIGPVRSTLIGSVEKFDAGYRTRWLEKVRELGRRAK
jgi:putative NADPH-quinone reductase